MRLTMRCSERLRVSQPVRQTATAFSTHRHSLRHAPPSLSLGSLGVKMCAAIRHSPMTIIPISHSGETNDAGIRNACITTRNSKNLGRSFRSSYHRFGATMKSLTMRCSEPSPREFAASESALSRAAWSLSLGSLGVATRVPSNESQESQL